MTFNPDYTARNDEGQSVRVIHLFTKFFGMTGM